MQYTVYTVVPVLPHKVKARWGYFTLSGTKLPVLCVYVEGTICRYNDLECSGLVGLTICG